MSSFGSLSEKTAGNSSSLSDGQKTQHTTTYRTVKTLGKGASGVVVLAVIGDKEKAIKQILCQNEYDLNFAMRVSFIVCPIDGSCND